MVTPVATREEMIATLAAIKRELEDNRLTIVRTIINEKGEILRTYRRTVRLARNNERNTP